MAATNIAIKPVYDRKNKSYKIEAEYNIHSLGYYCSNGYMVFNCVETALKSIDTLGWNEAKMTAAKEWLNNHR